jgi:hypothetical protein
LTAIRPAEIDALEKLSQQRAAQHDKLIQHLEQDVKRLEYAAHRAEQQYDLVDPRNRLIAATLEEKWESALVAVGQAREKLADARRETPKPLKVPADLRKAFADVGRRLPELWPRLSSDARKSLLRTLITQVNLLRESDGRVQIRIVWQGQLVTETSARLRAFSFRDAKIEQRVAERIRELSREGLNSKRIAERLNDEGFHPCRGEQFTEIIVTKLKRRFGILSNAAQARCGNLPFAYTLPEVARRIDRHPSWISRKIHQGAITIRLDPAYGCYLFPKTQHTIDQITKLKNREIRHVSIPAVHING